MKLVVENLPQEVTQKEVEKIFRCYGEVKKVTLAYNRYTGKFRGMAFVEMGNSSGIQRAVKGLNNTLVGPNCISVCESIPRSL